MMDSSLRSSWPSIDLDDDFNLDLDINFASQQDSIRTSQDHDDMELQTLTLRAVMLELLVCC